MFRSLVFGQPTKCPNRNCKALFYKDSHKGWLPKSELEIFAVMRCGTCRDTFLVAQMINMVHEYKESLPTRGIEKNKITIFTEDDQLAFRKELFADENPLWSLYDGFCPGATDNPEQN